MLFNSFSFLIFFPLVVFIYFFLSNKLKILFLLLSSYYFYMCWKSEYIILILLSTIIDYIAGLKMENESNLKRRKFYLYLSLISNLGLLFLFKYFNFFNNSFSILLENFNIKWGIPQFKLLLPVGISFYTFQTLSYTIDVYKKKIKAEKNFFTFALYVSFFPQLVAGPIERAKQLLPQFKTFKKFNYKRTVAGLQLMLWGFFKKIVIADNIAKIINPVFNDIHQYQGLQLILAVVFFSFQILCDFSGYSDIAIGTAKILGFRLMRNFRSPYFSKSISEFWSRWHISLSTWFKDYLYIQLGGNRVGFIRNIFNLLFTFLISGLWHGANFTFILWGALHGFYLLTEILTYKLINKLNIYIPDNKFYNLLKIIKTYILVCIAWIFFRSQNIKEGFYILTNILTNIPLQLSNLNLYIFKNMYIPKHSFLIIVISIFIMEFIHIFKDIQYVMLYFNKKNIFLRWNFYFLLILWIIFFGAFTESEFIYFQF